MGARLSGVAWLNGSHGSAHTTPRTVSHGPQLTIHRGTWGGGVNQNQCIIVFRTQVCNMLMLPRPRAQGGQSNILFSCARPTFSHWAVCTVAAAPGVAAEPGVVMTQCGDRKYFIVAGNKQ